MKRKPTFAPYIGPIDPVARDEDLIPQLATELGRLLLRCRVDRETRKAHVALVYAAGHTPGPMCGTCSYCHRLLNDLTEALSHYAPPYTYFGERDGEYGFWPVLDADEPARVEANLAANCSNYWGQDLLLVNDHGNVESGRGDRSGRFHSYWSAV